MPTDMDMPVQRPGMPGGRGGFPGGRGGFPGGRGGFPGGRGGFPGRFPRFPRFRRRPFFPFFPIFIRPGVPCFYIDRFGRCCDRWGRCCDRFGRCDPFGPFGAGESDDFAVMADWDDMEMADDDYWDDD